MISIILPTVRPQRLAECLPTIKAKVDHEIIVVTIDEMMPMIYNECGHMKHVKLFPREQWGPIDAINFGYQRSNGEYVFVSNDETTFHPEAIDKMVDSANLHEEMFLFGPVHKPDYDFTYYGKPFLPFVLTRRETLAEIHGHSDVFFDPIYKGFYADPDLCLKAAVRHIYMVNLEWPAVVYHTQRHDLIHRENVAAYLTADRATFRNRWDHLGEFKDP